ncbi:YqiA/YcfP family alpha/beta fold hydrolase [Glaciecola siphonariae]|uniref:YqiA/YcfP family alpha/beta fold hydrolase n=1 Tax=Glaciecola siphonariae TaxID=521012 RepID=A0ABV9LXY1_9ALTE
MHVHVIYLHGFLSSPQSAKAQQTKHYASKHLPSLNLHIPQLSGNITKAIASVEALIASLPPQPLRFIGSSMGGFLSTYFVEKYGGKAVLVNPAVLPYRLLSHYQGEHINPHSKERFFIHHQSIELLKALEPSALENVGAYKVLLQTGDETLDYRLAEQKYWGSQLTVEQGGDHSFVNFEDHLPSIFDFLR